MYEGTEQDAPDVAEIETPGFLSVQVGVTPRPHPCLGGVLRARSHNSVASVTHGLVSVGQPVLLWFHCGLFDCGKLEGRSL